MNVGFYAHMLKLEARLYRDVSCLEDNLQRATDGAESLDGPLPDKRYCIAQLSLAVRRVKMMEDKLRDFMREYLDVVADRV